MNKSVGTWIFQKCAKMAKKTTLFHDTKPPVHVTKPLMTENGKHAKTGGGLYGVLGVGQCFWRIGRGGVLLRLPEF